MLYIRKIFIVTVSITMLLVTSAVSNAESRIKHPDSRYPDSKDLQNNLDIYSPNIEEEFYDVPINDDFEVFNRAVFQFNKTADKIIIEPITLVYRHTVPTFAKNRVSDFLYNLAEPVFFVNYMLQGNPEKAGNSVGRFLTNSIWGLGGIFDVASEAGLEKTPSDFGITMGIWGVDTGNYVMLPLIGPSSTRDLPGRVVDTLMTPYTFTTHKDFSLSIAGANFISTREKLLDFTNDLEKTSIDEYATLRSMYFQKRQVRKNHD